MFECHITLFHCQVTCFQQYDWLGCFQSTEAVIPSIEGMAIEALPSALSYQHCLSVAATAAVEFSTVSQLKDSVQLASCSRVQYS